MSIKRASESPGVAIIGRRVLASMSAESVVRSLSAGTSEAELRATWLDTWRRALGASS